VALSQKNNHCQEVVFQHHVMANVAEVSSSFVSFLTLPTVTEVCMTLLVFYNDVPHHLLRDLQVLACIRGGV
jgi:hypothetical protein